MKKTAAVILTLCFFWAAFPVLSFAEDEFEQVTAAQKVEAAAPASSSVSAKYMIEQVQERSIWLTALFLVIATGIFFLKKYRLRYVTLLASLAILGFYQGGCGCSVSASVKIFVNIFTAHYILAAVFLLGVPVVFTLFTGRIFCGYVCPLGALQEFVSSKEKQIKVPYKMEKRFGWLRAAVLAALVIASLTVSKYIFETIDPFKAVFSLKGNAVQWILAALLFTLGLFLTRPFCRYLCPLAVWLKIAARFSFYKIKRDDLTCTHCTLCVKKCPVNAIDDDCRIDNTECIRCGQCIDVCPKKSLS